MKVRAVLRILRHDGWYEIARRGSDRQLKHVTRKGRVTVPGKLSDNLAPGTLNSILKQAGLKE
jgi:predicted RNA binding protein YcfA (HicA-like mRNA interferase family)